MASSDGLCCTKTPTSSSQLLHIARSKRPRRAGQAHHHLLLIASSLLTLLSTDLGNAALAASLPDSQALHHQYQSHRAEDENDEDSPSDSDTDACEGGSLATCRCLLACAVFGAEPSKCQRGFETAMSQAASQADTACDSMSCIVDCSRQLKCLTSTVSDRCYSVVHSTPSCSILCEDTTTTTTLTTTTVTSTTTTVTSTSTETSTTSTTTTTITTTPFNVASWTSWLDLVDSPPGAWELLAAVVAVPALICLRRRCMQASVPDPSASHPVYEVTPSSDAAAGEALFSRSSTGLGGQPQRGIEEGDGL
eukprot:CAMPEP_0206578162 /NCGR_PEP_ID=MMETSP0325_2-20121206/31796_1 /ASSEMBLY_ACC=CAM_ASM_000347 /TAXON_ID=2866 /ORGANISM="Crypthecodinium cohnii, Strain Seligo" /LENGTH=307 /DNA_ID=CAMNT_0054083743 /DNA_START=52 /DNA_END=975 /DNA_ORIENTATION=-